MQPRKGSMRLVHPAYIHSSGGGGGGGGSPSGSFSTSHSGSSPRKVARLEWTMAVLGYLHSWAVIVVGSCLLLSLAPTWREWHWGSQSSASSVLNHTGHGHSGGGGLSVGRGNAAARIVGASSHNSGNGSPAAGWWLESPTSFGMSLLFCASMAYFALDILALLWRGRGRFSSSKQRVVLHHALAISGLGVCVATGRDGPLVLVAFVLAELSNPPWFVLQLCKYASRSSSAWRAQGSLVCAPGPSGRVLRWLLRPLLYACLSMDLSLLHVMTFLLTRLMCLQFTAHAVMPFAANLATKILGTALTLLSALQFLDLLPALQQMQPEGIFHAHGNTHGSSGGATSHHSAGGSYFGHSGSWKNVESELSEMQQECLMMQQDSNSGAQADDSSQQRGGRRSRKGSGSGTNSPRGEMADAAATKRSTTTATTATTTTTAAAPLRKKLLFWC